MGGLGGTSQVLEIPYGSLDSNANCSDRVRAVGVQLLYHRGAQATWQSWDSVANPWPLSPCYCPYTLGQGSHLLYVCVGVSIRENIWMFFPEDVPHPAAGNDLQAPSTHPHSEGDFCKTSVFLRLLASLSILDLKYWAWGFTGI